MMRPRTLAAGLSLIATLLPTMTSAQRRGMGGAKEADWDAVASKKAPAGPTISAKDFEKLSPFKALLDKKKDLKLSDEQLVSLTSAHDALRAANAQRFGLLDSLRQEAKPKTSGTPSTEDEVRLVMAREALKNVVGEIRASFEEAGAKVDGLSEAQKPTATELLAKNAVAMQEMLREKMGGRGGPPGGPSGGPPGGGRSGRPPV